MDISGNRHNIYIVFPEKSRAASETAFPAKTVNQNWYHFAGEMAEMSSPKEGKTSGPNLFPFKS